MSEKPETVYKITIEAYGQTETLHFMGSQGHHKVVGVKDQEAYDGHLIHEELDRMYERSKAKS